MRLRRIPLDPDREDLALIKEISSHVLASDPALNQWLGEYSKTHMSRIAQDLHLTRIFFPNNSKLLDVGSIPPLFIGAAQRIGYDISGLDIGPDRLSETIAALQLNIRQCDVEKEPIPFESGTFDGVVFNEIFEHLRMNPIETLLEVKRVLKPGGLLVLSTPNSLSLRHILRTLASGRIGPDIYDEFEKLGSLGHMGHVREYTVNEVAEFLSKLGFHIQDVVYRGRFGTSQALASSKAIAANLVCQVIPRLRPFFTLIARKA